MKVRKYILYSIFLIVLLLPLVQRFFHLFKENPLTGAYIATEKPELNAESWFDGSFQSGFEAFANDNLGFHNTAVRLRNSFCFSVFHKANANVVVGKDNYLYEQPYIDARFGLDYIGRTAIEKRVRRIRQFQDSLDREGKKMIIFLAPSKADYFPEYLPKFYRKMNYCQDSTNYRQFKKFFKQYGVRYIDYNQYFIQQKEKTEYPLYPKYGIHWSHYGAVYAMDSLIRYAEQLLHVRLNRMYVNDMIRKYNAFYSDYDLAYTLNLARKSQLKGYPMYYLDVQWEKDTTLPKPNMLVIADSYYWYIYMAHLQCDCFTGNFWYYNKTVYPESADANGNAVDVYEDMQKADILLIMCTTQGLCDLGWGFFGTD